MINDRNDFYKIDTNWFKSSQFYARQQGIWIKYEESLYKNDLESTCKLTKKICSKTKVQTIVQLNIDVTGKELRWIAKIIDTF